jgi:hypothetical protein
MKEIFVKNIWNQEGRMSQFLEGRKREKGRGIIKELGVGIEWVHGSGIGNK